MRYRFWLICINYNFDFLVLYKMYFQNYFARRSIILESFTSHLHVNITYKIADSLQKRVVTLFMTRYSFNDFNRHSLPYLKVIYYN